MKRPIRKIALFTSQRLPTAGIVVVIMGRRWEYEKALDGNTGPCHLIAVAFTGGSFFASMSFIFICDIEMLIIVTTVENYCGDYVRYRQGATVPSRWCTQKNNIGDIPQEDVSRE